MKVLYEWCCGLDVHKKVIVACLITPGPDGRPHKQLCTCGTMTAEVLLAEVGSDLERFSTSRHLSSWAGLCPGNNESAGKRQSGRTRKGSPWLREALVEVARPAGKTKTYLGALYHRLTARRGSKRPAAAVAHTILVIAYHLLTRKQLYQDLGFNHHDELDRCAAQCRLVRLITEPSLLLQALTTRQSENAQIEVAIHAMNTVLAADEGREVAGMGSSARQKKGHLSVTLRNP